MTSTETEAELRAQIAALQEQLRSRRRWPEVALELLRDGTSRRDAAQQLGVSYTSMLNFTSKHRRETGERFRYSYPSTFNCALTERNSSIIDSYRELGTLEAVGQQFDITRERVRQIVARHERQTGTVIPRSDPHKQKAARVAITCPGCGRQKFVTEARRKVLRTEACSRRCAGFQHGVGKERVNNIIALRRALPNWRQVGLQAGYSQQAVWQAQRVVYMRLTYEGRFDEIAELWPKGIPNWLKKWDCTIKTAA